MSSSSVPRIRLPIKRHVLRCGATLLVSPRRGSPVTAVQVHLRGGHSLDAPGREGTAFLTGGLADQGTASYTEEGIAERLETAGGHVSGDSTGLLGNIVSSEWKILLDVIVELLTSPKYPKELVEKQKSRLIDRLLIEREDPRVQGDRMFRNLVYGDHWLGRPVLGDPEQVAAIRRRDLLKFHRDHWVPERAIVAICGDVDAELVTRFLDRRLSKWERGASLGALDLSFPERAARTSVFPSQRQQVHVHLGHLGIRREDPDFPALVVMDHVLGTGPGLSNRLSTRLREEQGLAYSVGASIGSSAGILPGVFSAYIGTSPQHMGTAIHGFLDEMRRIRQELVPRDELKVAVDYLVGSFVLGFQRASRRVHYMVSKERHGFPRDYLARLPALFAAVTADDVRAAAARHLYPEKCCVAAAGPVGSKELADIVRAASRSRGVAALGGGKTARKRSARTKS